MPLPRLLLWLPLASLPAAKRKKARRLKTQALYGLQDVLHRLAHRRTMLDPRLLSHGRWCGVGVDDLCTTQAARVQAPACWGWVAHRKLSDANDLYNSESISFGLILLGAGVGLQDGLRVAARTTATPLVSMSQARHLLRRAGPGRLARSRRATHCAIALLRHHPRPTMRQGMVPLGGRLPAVLLPSSATTTTHGPPCGRGWCSMAGTTCGGWD